MTIFEFIFVQWVFETKKVDMILFILIKNELTKEKKQY